LLELLEGGLELLERGLELLEGGLDLRRVFCSRIQGKNLKKEAKSRHRNRRIWGSPLT
jgi:hypothetical protein